MTEPRPRTPDPIADLAATLAALDVQSRQSRVVLARTEDNRINLLFVHAIAALVISVLFMASHETFRSPSWDLLRYIPGFPYTFAVVLLAGGLVLLPATIARHTRLEMAGLALLNIWYTALAIGFVVPAARWASEALPAIFYGEALPSGQPGLYAWAVYAHLSIIMRVHLWTLWRMRRDDRDEVDCGLEAPR